MNASSSSRLGHLVDLMRRNTATRVEVAELEDLLQDEALMAEYVELMTMESMLVASFGNEGADNFDRLFPHPARKPAGVGHSSWVMWGGVAAAVALCFTGLWLMGGLADRMAGPPESAAPGAEAERAGGITASFPMVTDWIGLSGADLRRFAVGTHLSEDEMTLDSGFLEIRTEAGCRVTIEAPAGFRMLDPGRLHLSHGKVSVESLDSRGSIDVIYGDGFHVWNGVDFAVSVPESLSGAPEITSIHGTLHIRSESADIIFSVGERQSLRHLGDGSAQTIPFAGDDFVHELPEQEFIWRNTYDRTDGVAWVSPGDAEYSRIYAFGDEDHPAYGIAAPKTLAFEVGDLVWGPGAHRAVLKWVNGPDAMSIEQMQLYRDGELVAEDLHTGKTGDISNTRDHVYELTIPEEGFQRGGWELRAKVRGIVRSNGDPPKFTAGILYFGDRRAFAATPADFLGDWHYQFDGRSFVRRVNADGTIKLIVEGKAHVTGRWWMEDGLLHALMNGVTESHMLRDKHTLIFVDRPYGNASREPGF